MIDTTNKKYSKIQNY